MRGALRVGLTQNTPRVFDGILVGSHTPTPTRRVPYTEGGLGPCHSLVQVSRGLLDSLSVLAGGWTLDGEETSLPSGLLTSPVTGRVITGPSSSESETGPSVATTLTSRSRLPDRRTPPSSSPTPSPQTVTTVPRSPLGGPGVESTWTTQVFGSTILRKEEPQNLNLNPLFL